MLSPASAVQPHDEGDGDEELCLELQARPEPPVPGSGGHAE
jgi:hypothetical protein